MEEVLKITGYTQKGVPYALKGDTKVEVLYSVLGDEVLVFLNKKRKRVIKGMLLKVIRPSPLRSGENCLHIDTCGGCPFQALQYEKQLEIKGKMIRDLFSEYDADIMPIIPSAQKFFYRNKLEFSFSENRAGMKFLGYTIACAKSYIFNVEKCLLASLWFSNVLNHVREFWQNSNLSAYNLHENKGTLKSLTLKEGKNTNEKMVILTVCIPLSEPEIEKFVQAVEKAVENPSIYIRHQKIQKGSPTEFFETHIKGPKTIHEKLTIEDKSYLFSVSPSSFFQPNTNQAEKLFEAALKMISPGKVLFDLYCGTGVIGIIFSHLFEKVIGIELNPDAVKNAEKNKGLNQINNYSLYTGDVGEVLKTLSQKPDLVIVDPPRAGLNPSAVSHLLSLLPSKILYISCNPKTQKEDIQKLKEYYHLEKIQPVDQFPHTFHLENMILLTRKT